MALIGGSLGLHALRFSNYILRKYYGGEPKLMDGSAYAGKSKMEVLLGAEIWKEIEGKRVLDFGCGAGSESIEMAQHGAMKVVGLDIVASAIEQARKNAEHAGVECEFTTVTNDKFDVILSFDAFEHYDDPPHILELMAQRLKPDGQVIISFGTPWYHPIGGHTFSPFPWAHLLFTEKALIKWRSEFRHDGATRFSEVEGGLNQMTITRFEKVVAESPFHFTKFQIVPIRAFKKFANRYTREFTTSTIRCRLSLKASQSADNPRMRHSNDTTGN